MSSQKQPDSSELPMSTLLQSLADMRDEHIQMLAQATTNEYAPVDAVHHLITAALRRSGALLEGFLMLVDAQNRFCAIPLIRLQLDSAMRVRACRLVADPTAFVKHVLEGGEPRKYKQNGIDLQDKTLHNALTNDYPHTSDLYQETNGYIHLSNHHLFGFFDKALLTSGVIRYTNHEELPPWEGSDVKGSIVSMMWATHVLTEECNALMQQYPRKSDIG